jgi:uncharacterized membrane protein YraQ (UPF0718 family)
MLKNILIELFKMIWDIYWALALGFMLSAFIRAYISTNTISGRLGKNNVKGLSLSSFFGAISSSCSYAAASMSRTLIIKGATWTNAIAFLIASTNLVFEIFLVIVTLLGWAFFGGEIIGGFLFIIVGAILIKWLLTKRSIEKAKEHIQQTEKSISKNNSNAHHAEMHTHEEEHNDEHHHRNEHEQHHNHKSATHIADAAGYFYMDVIMVGKDILIGVIISAIIAVAVPAHFWEALFLKNDAQLPQFIMILWNAVIGIIIAVFSFVCSVGNILLAAVLWHGGINFGGVIAFILSDLITIPMLMVYRRYYGTKMMWHLFTILSLSILITALAVDYIFQWAGWIPHQHGEQIAMQINGIQWNYTTILNIIFIPLSLLFFFKGKSAMK